MIPSLEYVLQFRVRFSFSTTRKYFWRRSTQQPGPGLRQLTIRNRRHYGLAYRTEADFQNERIRQQHRSLRFLQSGTEVRLGALRATGGDDDSAGGSTG